MPPVTVPKCCTFTTFLCRKSQKRTRCSSTLYFDVPHCSAARYFCLFTRTASVLARSLATLSDSPRPPLKVCVSLRSWRACPQSGARRSAEPTVNSSAATSTLIGPFLVRLCAPLRHFLFAVDAVTSFDQRCANGIFQRDRQPNECISRSFFYSFKALF